MSDEKDQDSAVATHFRDQLFVDQHTGRVEVDVVEAEIDLGWPSRTPFALDFFAGRSDWRTVPSEISGQHRMPFERF